MPPDDDKRRTECPGDAERDAVREPEGRQGETRPETLSEIIAGPDTTRPMDDDTGEDSRIRTRDPEELERELPDQLAVFHRYIYRGELGRGGMGKVLRVWDRTINRLLAMKVEYHATAGRGGGRGRARRNRFLQEAQVTGQLDHPGVVPVHDLGKDEEGRLFFTMRMVRGKDLQEVFQLSRESREKWSRTRVLGVFVKICDTLAYAHINGVIHRDLKPSNVMVGMHGEVYIMDWGLAKRMDGDGAATEEEDPRDLRGEPASPSLAAVEGRSGQTVDGTVLGTLAYMSPEQARGEVARLDARSDVYSVGAMLYELLTGRMPFVSEKTGKPLADLLASVQGEAPTPVEAIDPRVPEELVSICEKAMAQDPRERYATAEQLGEDIQAYLESRVVKAHRTGPWIEFRKWLVRNRALAASLTAAALFLLLGLIAVIVVQSHLQGVIDRRRYVANINAASWHLEQSDVSEARRLLEVCPSGLRGWEWRQLWLKSDGARKVLDHGGGVVHALAIGGVDERTLVTGSADGNLRSWTLPEGRLVRVMSGHRTRVISVAIAPSGDVVASGSEDGELRVWDLESGLCHLTLAAHASRILEVAFDPDGRYVISGSLDRRVALRDVRSGEVQAEWTVDSLDLTAMAVSPDARRVALGARETADGRRHRILIRDAATGAELHSLAGHEEVVLSLAFNPRGTILASGSGDNTVRLWDLSVGQTSRVLAGHSSRVLSLGFSGDGRRLVSGSGDNSVRVWDVDTGVLRRTLRGHEQEIFAVALRGESHAVISGSRDGTVRLWDARGTRHVSVLDVEAGRVRGVTFTADGNALVVTAGEDETTGQAFARTVVEIRDLRSLETISRSEIGQDPVTAVAVTTERDRVVLGRQNGTITVRSLSGDRALGEWRAHSRPVTALAIAPDRDWLASAGGDGTVRHWDPRTGNRQDELAVAGGIVQALAISPDGTRLAGGDRDGAVTLWLTGRRWPGGQWHRAGHRQAVTGLAFAPDGRTIASASRDKTLLLLNASDGSIRRKLTGHKEAVLAVAFAPDGRRLASGSWDNTVRIWEVDTGELLTILRGHEARVLSVAFDAGGKRLASGSWDRTVRIWEGQ